MVRRRKAAQARESCGMRVLLVEDEEIIGSGVQAALRQAGYAVDWLQDGHAAAMALKTEQFDLVLLDLGLPDRSGLDVLAELRTRGDEVPVLILTARDSVPDRVSGLDRGADDYLTKPFDLDELFARLRALARRRGGRANPLLIHGDITLDPAARKVTLGDKAVDISRREFSLLQLLLENSGRVLSRGSLEESLYGWGDVVESNTVEVYIHHLRKKLGSELIRTVRGVGYMVDRPPSETS
jgi:DNA-binding response OmpR family regulator